MIHTSQNSHPSYVEPIGLWMSDISKRALEYALAANCRELEGLWVWSNLSKEMQNKTAWTTCRSNINVYAYDFSPKNLFWWSKYSVVQSAECFKMRRIQRMFSEFHETKGATLQRSWLALSLSKIPKVQVLLKLVSPGSSENGTLDHSKWIMMDQKMNVNDHMIMSLTSRLLHSSFFIPVWYVDCSRLY